MVIWFNVKRARDFLLKHGFVYTLRPKKRREGIEPLFYDGFGKKGTVRVTFCDEVFDYEQLSRYLYGSGFETIDEWIRNTSLSYRGCGFLYYVELVK